MAPYFYHFSLLQTILVVYSLVIFTCNGSSLSHYDECFALFQFKKSIIHQDDVDCAASWFQTFHTWKPTSDSVFDCCLWYGVECSNDHEYDHVIGVDLSGCSLCGNINSTSTLFSLVHLQSLDLSMNYFRDSQIPSEIAHLKKLRILNLSDSGFSGHVPNEISHLMQLSSLDLSWNSLKLQSPSGLKNLLTNLTGLEELHLSGVEISYFVPHFLANFSSLRSIKLYNCSLKNEFPSAILHLPKLKILDVSSNLNLTGSLPEFKNNLLQHVDLSGCSFTGRIPYSFSNLSQLSVLALGSNTFTGFVPSLVSLSKLKVLELDGSKFEKGRLPNWLGKLTELNIIRVSEMNIKGEISPFLANLTKLGVLDMGENFLIGHTPSWLFNLTQLRVLDLHQNQLKGPISSSFSNLKTLQCLHLGSNNFSGRVDLDMFLGLNKLEIFILNDNMLSVEATTNYTSSIFPKLKLIGLSKCNLNEFPVFLRFQNRIKFLYLDDNKVDGMVPVWIWNNNKETLRVIDLSNNSITGFHKHPQYLRWERLRMFLVDNNQVLGIGGSCSTHTWYKAWGPNNRVTDK
ncbi:hypothetical protein LXL04_037943 [Taraxacum kok-saghyz]